jgi:septal ring factor EnvC (AmiA/AmiB activator)
VKSAVDSLVSSRAALEATLRESLRLQSELQTKRAELEAKRTTLQTVMRQIKEKQQAAQQSLAKLRAEAGKMEELLRAITTEEQSEPAPQVTPVQPSAPIDTPSTTESPNATNASVGGSTSQINPEDVMHPEGLFGKSVRVSYPVKGQLLRSFGKSKVTDFSDIIFSKGMEFKTAESSQVKAVLGGRVAFSGSMPGYDTVVIIDHGSRSYSLYGRLGKAFVAKGELVKRGTQLGVTSTPDAKGRNFYFETRRTGIP